MGMQSLKNYYDNLFFIFVICPCCGNATPLSACNIRVRGEPPTFGRLDPILRLQEKKDSLNEDIEGQEDYLSDLLQECADLSQEISCRKTKEKIREQGRREAARNIKKVDPIFTPRRIDPQDVTLLFTPIDFVVFKGITANKLTERILFLTRQADSAAQEKTILSIDKTIRKGAVKFVEVRISDTGTISYE